MLRGRGGIKYEDVLDGTGASAERGNEVDVNYSLNLHRGDVVQEDLHCTFRVGQRRIVPGLEYGVEGMKVGGVRRIRVGPHLAYREVGVPGVVPADAVIEFTVRLIAVRK